MTTSRDCVSTDKMSNSEIVLLLKDCKEKIEIFCAANKNQYVGGKEATQDLYPRIAQAIASLSGDKDGERYRFIRDRQATIIYKRTPIGEWEPLVDTRETSTRCKSLDEAIDASMKESP